MKSKKNDKKTPALKKLWGKHFDFHLEIARGAVGEIGATPEQVTFLESVLGFTETMTLFLRLGALIQIKRRKEDKKWVAKYLGGSEEHITELGAFMKIAYPE